MADKNPVVLNNGEFEVLQAADKLPISAIATGTPDGTKFIRDDGTLATPAGGSGSVDYLALQMFNTVNYY
jgi:hypothetical protein